MMLSIVFSSTAPLPLGLAASLGGWLFPVQQFLWSQRCPMPISHALCPNDLKCLDLSVCTGVCEPKSRFLSCGSRRPIPQRCDDYSRCIDDPRFPHTCGLACEIPGICVSKQTPKCGSTQDRPCPRGLRCYDMPCEESALQPDGDYCVGICL
ncbi:hypothetical protein HRG_012049 [Hirsutella rhossiliensis]